MAKKHMSMEEKADWEELYEFVRKNVMGYDENQSLSKDMVLRLKGLLNNKFMANNNIDDTANYSYKVILNTFKFSMIDIQRGLSSNSFKDERHKTNYIIKIVEANVNTVYMRMKNAEKSKQKTAEMEMKAATHTGANYQSKTKETSNNLNNLW